MVKKTKGKSDAEKQEAERQESALRGKALSSEQTGSGTQSTSRQQTLAAKKAKGQKKRAGKSVVVATDEDSGDESADEQAPTKRARMSKGKEVAVDRDKAKTPSVEELYHHLLNEVTWTPTRFADLDLLKELGLDSDIEAMLRYMKMPKLLTMAYPVYRDVSCQFLSSLEVTYHDAPHVRQGWGKTRFKVKGRYYNMNFKDIGRVMGFQDLADYSLPKCKNLPTELWKLITGNKHSTEADKNSHIRHPSVRYLHKMLVHAFYPRKQAGNVTEEDIRLLCPAIRPYAPPRVFPLPSTDIYATFRMVSFFVNHLEHYRDWAWYTTDSHPKVGIGGMITPLLQFLNVPLGKDAAGPKFIDGTYLRISTYFNGMYGKDYVYHYYLQGKPVEVVPMGKKTKGKSDAEKQEAERRESTLRGKNLSSEQTGSGTQRTSRQQTLAAKKTKEHKRRAGKSVAVATDEESGDESADEHAPSKRAKMSKGKEVAVDRDRAKTPSKEELYHHLLNEVTWTPTRFADLDLLKELGLDSDIEAMLGHLKMPKLLTTWPTLSTGMSPLWKLITGNKHSTGVDKNSHIRHPSVRYLHRMLVHAFYPWKQAGNVTEEDMRLLYPAIRPYAPPRALPLPSTNIYATFAMVSFFVNRLEHYKDWAWYTTDSHPKVGIGGMITPLLQFLNVPLGKDAAGPKFIDGTYLRIATYFSGMYGKDYVYHYYLQGKLVEVVLPNQNLTSLERPGAISFNISQGDFLGEHGSLGPIAPPRKRSVPTRHYEPPREASVPVYGPPRYYFKPHDGVLPPGALRDAHEHIGRLQRWNKAQDRTIEKLKDKCKALSKTVKKQAKTSAKFMKKVADVLTRGGIAGCSSADFAETSTLPGLTRTHISGTRLYATSIGCSSMHSTHGSKLVMSLRKTCDCSARLSTPTPPLECFPFQAPTFMLPSGWSASS
ncbi:hypothetical protein F2Q69_00041249 [Brassica cretica]|uniref:Arabidopsis retrotransposon Orf1 C-terminal domain-containing protein n=1 Tax=Brassica cretica TaxID=69181 RepID=A0A8S9NB28_BRACR|nr:hypothetical protein F2Q69_00041249 [Brassica cretica]